MKKITALLIAVFMIVSLVGCAKGEDSGDMMNEMDGGMIGAMNGAFESYAGGTSGESDRIVENRFVKTSDEPTSTFSADVDTAAYSYFRKLVNSNYSLEQIKKFGAGSMRTEEMINYFDYDYKGPEDGKLFGTNVQISSCPWNEKSALMVLGLKTEEIEISADNNLVFLIDVSGSMKNDDKLPLLKKAFSYLVAQLDEKDTVSIVTYSGKEKIVLSGCAGNKSEAIMEAVNSLEANGSTNGEAGLKMAYSLAEDYFISGGNNRIIMASDGDLNVGMSSPEELKAYVAENRESGIYLSVLGFGSGNFKDSNMEAIADNGNGVYYYIDGEREAEKVFGSDIFSTLYTAGRDVKLQITFNPEAVSEYRLVGYENRLLNNEDFDDDTKDAGEVGVGHCVTVCYEIILTDKAEGLENEWMTLAMRYKLGESAESTLDEVKIGKEFYTDNPNADFVFIGCVAQTSMLLIDSRYLPENFTLDKVLAELWEADISGDAEKEEFRSLLVKIKENSK